LPLVLPESSGVTISRRAGVNLQERPRAIPRAGHQGGPISEFQEFCSLRSVHPLSLVKHGFFVEPDHGPPAEGAASFHTTRWAIVMKAAQSQAQGGAVCFSRPSVTKAVHRTVARGGRRHGVGSVRNCGITPKGIFMVETIVGSTITLYTDRSFRSGGSPTEKDMLDQFKKKADESRMAASEQNP
jgi:hypothetical protein